VKIFGHMPPKSFDSSNTHSLDVVKIV
jgi:hypothetical protein